MTNEISVESFKIGNDHPPFVIAEISGNHNGDLNRALALVEAAGQAGAHALKLQTYTADTMTIDLRTNEFFIDDASSLWNGSSLYELYERAHTPWEWHEKLFSRARDFGMVPFSTPFDATAVDFLESLDTPLYKIASFENTDHELIAKVARTGKPIIISNGMASIEEISESVQVARSNGCRQLILLQCTSAYPANPADTHLRTIKHMQELFGVQVGLSDHTLGIGVSVAAVALGATVIEKHLTLSRNDGGVDSAFSLNPSELSSLVSESRAAWSAIGRVQYGFGSSEQLSKSHRRSLYFVEDIAQGEEISRQNVRAIRPGLGLPVKHLQSVLGKTARVAIKRGTPVSWDYLL